MKCSKCGENNDPGLRFCIACGRPLRDPAVEPDKEGESSLLPTGTVLKSTYEIIRPLGEGGAGVVYEGRHVDLGHAVAIKVLFSHLARVSSIRERFIEEGRIQANLRHPNLVQVHDIIEEGGKVAIVMEYIDGQSLHFFIHQQKQPVPIVFAVHLMLRLLAGLGTAHANGVIHRDIKPGNVLLAGTTSGLVPKLCDFGIAKVVSSRGRTVTGTKMGTVYYMAPEQFEDARRVDSRADIYSLGVTLYELLTQRLPFESENEFAIIRAHLEVDPPSLRGYRPDIGPELDQLVLKSLAKRPQDRFNSCEAMSQALIELPGFETLKGYVSHPAVLEVGHGSIHRGVPPGAFSPGIDLKWDRFTGRIESTDRDRADAAKGEDETHVAEKPTLSRTSRHFPWFPLFLGLFAASLVGIVVIWSSSRDSGSTSSGETLEGRLERRWANDPESLAAIQGGVQLADEVFEPGFDEVDGAQITVGTTPPDGRPVHQTGDLSSDTCLALVEQVEPVLALEGGETGDLLATLETTADRCRSLLMESVGDNLFDVLWAQLQADRLTVAKHILRAYRAESSEQRCLQVVLANRSYERSRQRIQNGLDEGRLLDFEEASMRELGRWVMELQGRLPGSFPDCQW